MLRSAKSLRNYHIRATDGNIGRVGDLLFDGKRWIVRYAVVDTSEWLPGRKVLLVLSVCGPPDTEEEILPVALTREQVENSPPIEADKPVSRQHEADLFEYYGWSPYWGAGRNGLTEHVVRTQRALEPAPSADANLRSMQEVAGYSIHAADGHIGHVEDFVIDDKEWVLRYIVADTRNRLPGRRVLISPQWVRQIDWQNNEVWLDLSREDIRKSPPYDPGRPVNRQYELRLYDYYGRRKYWA
jgi:sporulation protein YlmC with PRC-barrel domain